MSKKKSRKSRGKGLHKKKRKTNVVFVYREKRWGDLGWGGMDTTAW